MSGQMIGSGGISLMEIREKEREIERLRAENKRLRGICHHFIDGGVRDHG